MSGNKKWIVHVLHGLKNFKNIFFDAPNRSNIH
jgi:hypothetical protein